MDKQTAAVLLLFGQHSVDVANSHSSILEVLLKRTQFLEDKTRRIAKAIQLRSANDEFTELAKSIDAELAEAIEAEDRLILDSQARMSTHREKLEAYLEQFRAIADQP